MRRHRRLRPTPRWETLETRALLSGMNLAQPQAWAEFWSLTAGWHGQSHVAATEAPSPSHSL